MCVIIALFSFLLSCLNLKQQLSIFKHVKAKRSDSVLSQKLQHFWKLITKTQTKQQHKNATKIL